MARPPGFAHHAKAAKAAHAQGDHTTANHHIGKMFAMNRRDQVGSQAPEQEGGEAIEPQTETDSQQSEPRGLGNWMDSAVKHPGALHGQLGVPSGKKIPAKKIAKAEHSDNPLLAKRARLAETFARFRGT